MKLKFNPIFAKATEDKIAGDKFKLNPIASGCVRFERHDYHYSRQGAVSLVGYTIKDIPELECINWLGGSCSVQWPDGYMELFDTRVTPAEHSPHLGYGYITRLDGKQASGTLSRLANVFVEYYGPRLITAQERDTFKRHVFDYELAPA